MSIVNSEGKREGRGASANKQGSGQIRSLHEWIYPFYSETVRFDLLFAAWTSFLRKLNTWCVLDNPLSHTTYPPVR